MISSASDSFYAPLNVNLGLKAYCMSSINYLQGLFYVWSESYCLFPLKYEWQWLLEATGGLPDVVHLIIHAPQELGQLLWVIIVLKANCSFVWKCRVRAVLPFFKGVFIFDLIFWPIYHKIKVFLCPLERKNPKLFKIGTIFISSLLLRSPKTQ